MRVYIFGSSKAGDECYDKISKYCDIKGFIDNDSKKWGTQGYMNLPVYSVDHLMNKTGYDLIMIASSYTYEIIKQLNNLDVNPYILCPLNPADISHRNFKVYIDYSQKAFEFHKIIDELKKDIWDLSISDYNRNYLFNKEIKEFFLYADFLWNVYKLHGVSKKFLDYGGGTGLLGMFAYYIGVEAVYYNDIYEISCSDAQHIANKLSFNIKGYIQGDIDEVIEYSEVNNIKFDTILSFDVLEHIYDLPTFFNKLINICQRESTTIMWSTANSLNPIIINRLESHHYQREYLGSEENKSWKKRDSAQPYVLIRKNIIQQYFQQKQQKINEITLAQLTSYTKGRRKEDIIFYIEEFLQKGVYPEYPKKKFESNTADPLTGNWAEHLIDFDQLFKSINHFEKKELLPELFQDKSYVIGLCLQNKGYSYLLEEWIDKQDIEIYRYKTYYYLLVNWLRKVACGQISNWLLKNDHNNIYIYGGGELGQILYTHLIKDGIIHIKGICDSKVSNMNPMFSHERIITIENLFAETIDSDTVIVTPVYAFEMINKTLQEGFKGNIISLSTIIEEM